MKKARNSNKGKRLPRATCPKCGLEVLERNLDKHIDDGWCISRRNLNQLRRLGYDIPSHYNVAINTVQMLAKHAGIELVKEPVCCLDYGHQAGRLHRVFGVGTKTPDGEVVTQRYMVSHVYVAPIWLIKIAAAWRGKWSGSGQHLGTNAKMFPQTILDKLPEAVNNERLQKALVTQLTLKRKR